MNDPKLNVLEIILLYLSISSLHFFLSLETFVFRRFVIWFYHSRIIVLMIFSMSAADIKSLGYLFSTLYWIVSPFGKLEYPNWSELEHFRYATHLLKYSDLIFVLYSAPVAFLKSSRFSTKLPSMSLPMCSYKMSLAWFRNFE